MKPIYYISALITALLISGCYTQLETVQRDAPRYSAERPAPSNAYDDFYMGNELEAYEDGYYDGYFDAQLDFRDYRYARNRTHIHIGFHRPFVGFGYSYSYFYDPHWHFMSLYDPFFFSYYGYYAYPPHYRYRHWGFFHSPFWGPRNTFIVYNNYYFGGSSSVAGHTGPRSSGVHRGTIADRNAQRDSRRNVGVAGRSDILDTRIRNGSGNDNLVRSRTNVGGGSGTASSSVERRTRGEATTRQPQTRVRTETRSPERSGTVDRSRNTGSSGNARTNTRTNTNRGTVNRGSSSTGSRATPPRTRTNNNRGTNRSNRDRNNESSLSSAPQTQSEHRVVRYTPNTTTRQTERNRQVSQPIFNNRQNSRVISTPNLRTNNRTTVRSNQTTINSAQPRVQNNRQVNNRPTRVTPQRSSNNNSAVNRSSSRNSSSERSTNTRSRNN